MSSESDELLELLDDGELFEVVDYDHPDFTWHVSFDDVVAHEHDEALDRLTDEIAARPDVVRAVREDREVILVGGAVGGRDLEAWIGDWWRTRLRGGNQPPRP